MSNDWHFKRNKDPALYSEFCRVRNQVQRDIKMAKEGYFKGKIEQNHKHFQWMLLTF